MTQMKVDFKVAMDAEQKKLKNLKDVKFNVEFEGVSEEDIYAAALKSQVVLWQSQIRNNWNEFVEKGLPETVTFGTALYGKSTTRRAPTEEDVVNYIMKLSPEGLAQLASTGKLPDKDAEGCWK